MDNEKKLVRTWCTECKEWTVHVYETIDGQRVGMCEMCENIFTGYNISDIPEDKVKEQQKRYRDLRHRNFHNVLQMYQNIPTLNGILPESEIIEDDVGIKQQAKLEKEHKIQKVTEYKQHLENYPKNIGRNDKCPCKSGEKFKKCCQDNYNDIVRYVKRYSYLLEQKGK